MSKKSSKLAGFWECKSHRGSTFYASNKISFGELRAMLKEFKENEEVANNDSVVFYLFPYDGENEKAPTFHLNIKKDDYKKG